MSLIDSSDNDVGYLALIEAWQDYSSRVEACIYAIYYGGDDEKTLRANELEAAKIRYEELFAAWRGHHVQDIDECGLGNGCDR